MKNILNIILLFISFPVLSQVQIVPLENYQFSNPGTGATKYYKDTNHILDKYLGTWKYQNTNTNPSIIVEITFYKKENISVSNYYEDIIYARFKFTKNGQVVYNTYNNIEEIGYSSYISGSGFPDPNNTNDIYLQYHELEPGDRRRKSVLVLQYIAGTPQQLHWKLSWQEIDENATAPQMPEDIILTKQN